MISQNASNPETEDKLTFENLNQLDEVKKLSLLKEDSIDSERIEDEDSYFDP